MQPKVFLETQRIRLHRFDAGDALLLYELDNDPDVMKYLTRGEPTPLGLIENEILPRWISFYDRFEHLGYWAAVARSTGEFIGWFHFRPHKINEAEIELGYRLMRRFWRQGYATEVSRELMRRAFSEWNIDRIVAATLSSNLASRRVMEKCGLRFEATFIYDERSDWPERERQSVRYGIDRQTWLAEVTN